MPFSFRLAGVFLCVVLFMLSVAGCSDKPTQDVNIVFEGGNTRTVDVGQTVTINADITNNNGQGITWSCSGACSASDLASAPSTGQVISILFKATTAGTATLTATANQERSFSRSITITIINTPSLTGGALAPATIGIAYNQTLQETGGTTPLTYTVTSGSLPAGLNLNGTTGVISGTPTGSTAGQSSFTVTVKDSGNPVQTASAQYTINVELPLSITASSLPGAFVGTAYTTTISATGGTAPYTFSIDASGTQLPAGLTLSNANNQATISGMATTVGTYTNIIVDVHDSQQPTANSAHMAFSLSVSQACGSGDESLLNGQYAMLVKGFDNGKASGETTPQPVFIGAVLYIDGNGNVVAGDLDMNSNGTHGIQESGVTGTYQIGSDQRGCMTLTSQSGTQHYLISVAGISSGIASTVHMADSDTTGPFTSGVALEQDTAAFSTNSINGNYVFGMSSPQGTASPDRGQESMAGVITLANGTDGANGTVSGGTFDLNDEGQLDGSSSTSWSAATPLSISSTGGIYYIGSGIGSIIFNVPISGNTVQVHEQIYIVSANQFLVMTGNDQTQSGSIFGAGEAFKQSTISSNSLNGTSVLYTSALQVNSPNPATATSFIGTLTGDASGNVTISGWQNNGSAVQSRTITGTVQIAANGRTTFLTGGGTNPPLLWLADNNHGFLLGAGSDAESGVFEPQTSTSVTTGTPYSFGSINPEIIGSDQQVGIATLSGSNITGTTDDNIAGTLSLSNPISLSYSVDANGLGTAPSGCTVGTVGSGGCQQIFYVISPTRAVLMNLQTGQGQIVSTPLETADQ
jgi:Putative Ig domain